ncbi:MAG TPA: signal peptide peptidase SppA [Noviherbaspirillum sp.]
MKILDILSAPWAIIPSKLQELQEIYATHLRGEKIDIAGVEARLGRPLANETKSYEIIDGVAILPLEGVVAKKMNLFMQISGGTSTQIASRNLREALADPAVHSIIQYVDSPGGAVDGTQGYANEVFAARDTKPIVTLASGLMASAGYWFGSAAPRIYIADDTTQVGSIGVIATHIDVSQSEQQRGIKTTEIYAGKYKRIASEYAPLTEDGRRSMQEKVDYLYSIFVSAVAKHRGVDAEKVLKDMADGRVFIGQQAIDAGLVDGVSTLEDLVRQLNQERGASSSTFRAGVAQTSTTTEGTAMQLTAEQVAAEYPDIAQAFRAEGAAAERARIQAVEGQLIPGHEALINSLKFDGKSTGGDAAQAVLAAERTTRNAQAKAIASEAPSPLPQEPTATVQTTAKESDDESLPLDERCKAKWEKDASVRSEFVNFESYLAFEKASARGGVKILGKKTA